MARDKPKRHDANLQAKEEGNQIARERRAEDVFPVRDNHAEPDHRQVNVGSHRSKSHKSSFEAEQDQPLKLRDRLILLARSFQTTTIPWLSGLEVG